MITQLQLQVLARYEVQLHKAGPLQFDHLAERAEGDYGTELGDRMHELVDFERSARMVAAGMAGRTFS